MLRGQYSIIITHFLEALYFFKRLLHFLIIKYCRVRVREVLHCRCEQTQTQQAQYNEFGKEVGSRTGP